MATNNKKNKPTASIAISTELATLACILIIITIRSIDICSYIFPILRKLLLLLQSSINPSSFTRQYNKNKSQVGLLLSC